jgi:hypothetical protein
MIHLVITNRLHRKIVIEKNLPRLISMRPLTKKEIAFARKVGIRRFYLPSLSETESIEFLGEFDTFWNQVIEPFGLGHPFWRNVVSSKMQEWEGSAAYLTLMLFTLARKSTKESPLIVIVCSSIEEEDLCEAWGEKMGWKVYRRPYLSLPSWSRRIVQEVMNLNHFLYMSLFCFYNKWFSPRYEPKLPKTNGQTLIVSLFYNSSFKEGGYRDHFFGNLHNIIRQNGSSVSYLCGPLDEFREAARKVRDCGEVSILIPHSIIPWCALIRMMLKVFMRRIQFDKSHFLGIDFSSVMTWNARRFEYFFNLDSELYYTAIMHLCRKEAFDKLIHLYEGNVFERACIQAFRKNSSGLIVGYSHAVVFPLNLKIRLTDGEKEQRPEPDFLVSTGPEGKRLMVKIGNRESTRIHSACSLRYIPVSDITRTEEIPRSNILVALDGVRAAVTVLDWLFENAESLKDYKVKLRAHPNVPVNILLNQCLHNIPDNFSLSTDDLKADIESSFCVIYRQSSVGMQALMNGVPVIHLYVDAPLPCDPIMDLKVSKWAVSTIGELLAALQEIHSSRAEDGEAFIGIAQKYAKDYFTLPDKNNVMRFFGEKRDDHLGLKIVNP